MSQSSSPMEVDSSGEFVLSLAEESMGSEDTIAEALHLLNESNLVDLEFDNEDEEATIDALIRDIPRRVIQTSTPPNQLSRSAKGSQESKETEKIMVDACADAAKQFQLPSKTKLNINIQQVTMTATWRWMDKDDTCGICRAPYESCCSTCRTPGDECPLGIAECRHAFHIHCILKWVQQQSRSNCPLCRFEWRTPPLPIFAYKVEDLNRQPERPRIPSENNNQQQQQAENAVQSS